MTNIQFETGTGDQDVVSRDTNQLTKVMEACQTLVNYRTDVTRIIILDGEL